MPDFFSVFISYNPKDNKLYLADNRTFTRSDIWELNVGLPQKIECPPALPATPTYSYSYVSNNFEFDNNGDVWSLSAYNVQQGSCSMDKFDLATGQIISTRILQFPQGQFPGTISSGDLCILPNGRMFATLGSSPSRLYEIVNYNSTTGDASAIYLQTMPQPCYGIAYLNGLLEITGTNLVNSCYFYTYNISQNTLSAVAPFQNGQAPIDNASVTPAIGLTKALVLATPDGPNAARLRYDIYVRNMGNVVLNDVSVTEDLGKVFGAANLSEVSASFVPGENPAGLTLNASWNGTTVTNLLAGGQNLPNQTGKNTNYYSRISIECRVANLQPNVVYNNWAIGNATINNAIDQITIADSSNNGNETMVDPNNNGNANEPEENLPTPFTLGVLPLQFLSFTAHGVNDNKDAQLQWEVSGSLEKALQFDIQHSTDGWRWQTVGTQPVVLRQTAYRYLYRQLNPFNNLFRIKQTDKDGSYTYSKVETIAGGNSKNGFTIITQKQNQRLQIQWSHAQPAQFVVRNMQGQLLTSGLLRHGNNTISLPILSAGVYLLQVTNNLGSETKQFVW